MLRAGYSLLTGQLLRCLPPPNNNGNFSSAYPVAQSTEQAYTHNVHQDGKCYQQKKRYRQAFKHNYAKDAHTHTHTVQTDRSEGQCGLTEIF